jgi:hypothetical protein
VENPILSPIWTTTQATLATPEALQWTPLSPRSMGA